MQRLIEDGDERYVYQLGPGDVLDLVIWGDDAISGTYRIGPDGEELVDGMLKTYIRAATERADKSWIRSAFVDNAGIDSPLVARAEPTPEDEALGAPGRIASHGHAPRRSRRGSLRRSPRSRARASPCASGNPPATNRDVPSARAAC